MGYREKLSYFQGHNEFAKVLSYILRFDGGGPCSFRRKKNKFSAIHELWDIWMDIANSSKKTVHFEIFCLKIAKYCVKFLVLCNSETSYLWNIQSYHGNYKNQLCEKDQGPCEKDHYSCNIKSFGTHPER